MPGPMVKRATAVLAVATGALLGVTGTDSAMGMARNDDEGSAAPQSTATAPADDSATPDGQQIVDLAADQEGSPYVWGGDGPDSFDCSGLIQWTHQQADIDLPRTAQQQRDALSEIPQDERRPGDLVFFADGGHTYHVGIYAGDGEMWAAPEPGDVVHLQEIWTNDYTVGRAW